MASNKEEVDGNKVIIFFVGDQLFRCTMFAKVLLRNQRAFFGKGAVLCLATAVAFPVINKQYKLTVCDKGPEHEVKKVDVVVPHVEPIIAESTNEATEIEVPKTEQPEEAQIVVDESDEDDAAWVEEKQKCSFCKMFILSPCKKQFKNWSNCVDKAKAEDKDFASVCSDYTKALMGCTSDNSEYFQALESAAGEEEAPEEGQGQGEAGAAQVEGATSPAGAAAPLEVPGPILTSEEDEK